MGYNVEKDRKNKGGRSMNGKAVAALLMTLILLTGCCYSPGRQVDGFWIMPEEVTPLPLEEYHASSQLASNDTHLEPIAAPKVDLSKLPKREKNDLVLVKDYIPDIVIDLKYAGTQNFMGTQVYEFQDLYLRYGTVIKLMSVQENLRQQGLLLKVWDGFRPTAAQHELWRVYPNPVYVQDPSQGFSDYSRGSSLAVTLVDAQGRQLQMPSDFDDFTSRADTDYSDCTDAVAANAILLQSAMASAGFNTDSKQWWHFTDKDGYEVEQYFDPAVISTWKAVCSEFINIRQTPDVNGRSIGHIPADGRFTLLGWADRFAYVDFEGVRGFVNADFIAQVN
jgi:D-alanyl-D-alanine dipeptidase